MTKDSLNSLRRATMTACGARGEVVEEILAYTANPFRDRDDFRLPALPLADEPHVARWKHYGREATAGAGAWPVLQAALRQLQFGIREGISDEPAYRSATRRGQRPSAPEADARLRAPEGLGLYLHPTLAGRIPVIETTERADFEYLVQALTARNEPEPVPASMGACIVAGLNNWDRIDAHRRAWQAENPVLHGDAQWSAEFKRLTSDKAAYQDRFLLLSNGPYGAVPAGETGMDEQTWLARSLVLRREHECTHYFTARALGTMRNHLLDELAADYVGIVHALGHYRPELARRAFGLADAGAPGPDARLQIYRGSPPLGDEAFAVVAELARRCIANLAAFDADHGPRDALGLARFVTALTYLTLEEIAAPDLPSRLADQLRELAAAAATRGSWSEGAMGGALAP